jgi:hypothetical protein
VYKLRCGLSAVFACSIRHLCTLAIACHNVNMLNMKHTPAHTCTQRLLSCFSSLTHFNINFNFNFNTAQAALCELRVRRPPPPRHGVVIASQSRYAYVYVHVDTSPYVHTFMHTCIFSISFVSLCDVLLVWGKKGRWNASVLAQRAQAGKRAPLSCTSHRIFSIYM